MARGLVSGEVTAASGMTSARPRGSPARTSALLDRRGKAEDNLHNGHDQQLSRLCRAAATRCGCAWEGAAIIPTRTGTHPNRDSDYLYRFDSYFYYLSGSRARSGAGSRRG